MNLDFLARCAGVALLAAALEGRSALTALIYFAAIGSVLGAGWLRRGLPQAS